MPRVPQYQTAQVKNSPLPEVRYSANATADSFGGADAQNLAGVAAGAGRLGSTLGQIAYEEQDALNKSLVRDALSSAKTEVRNYLTNDIYQRKGLNASNVVPEVQKRLEVVRDSRLKGLQNDAQRQIFSQMFTDIQDEHIGHVQTFQMHERKAYEHASIAAENQNAIEDAVLNRLSPDAIKKAEETIRFNTAYQNRGMGSDVVKHEEAKGLSILHEKILNSVARDSSRAGLQYLEKNKDKFLPTEYEGLKDTLEKRAMSEISNEKAAMIANQPGMTPDKAREWVDQNVKDGKESELVMSGVKARLAEKQAAMTLAQRQAVESTWQNFIKDPTQEVPTNIPASEQIKMRNYKVKMAKAALGEANQSAYSQIISLPTEKLASLNLFEHKADLSQHDFEYLAGLQSKLRKGGDKETEAFKKSMADAKHEAGQLDIFKITEADSEESARQKQDALNQYLGEYTKRLRNVPDEKRMDWKTAKDIRDELLKDAVLEKKSLFGIDLLWKDRMGRQFQVDSGASRQTPSDESYGLRNDGSAKQNGFLGPLKMTDGSNRVMTELSVGVNIGGKEMNVPTIVPTLTAEEINYLLSGGVPTPGIVSKAIEHANIRISQGKSPFAGNNESSSSNLVRVVSPDGQSGFVPKDKLDAALKAGYKTR